MSPLDEGAWIDVGLDGGDLMRSCICHGWSLQDVLDVLAVDDVSANSMDWCYTGLDPLEVRAAIQAGLSAELSFPRRATVDETPKGES